jgi:dGTPase
MDEYLESDPNQLTVDFIASMTDDYFIDLYSTLFPKSDLKIVYKGYFED